MIDYPRVKPYRGRYKPSRSEPEDQRGTGTQRQQLEQQRREAARKLAERHNAPLRPSGVGTCARRVRPRPCAGAENALVTNYGRVPNPEDFCPFYQRGAQATRPDQPAPATDGRPRVAVPCCRGRSRQQPGPRTLPLSGDTAWLASACRSTRSSDASSMARAGRVSAAHRNRSPPELLIARSRGACSAPSGVGGWAGMMGARCGRPP